MKCEHKKIVESVDDIDKIRNKDIVCYCFDCGFKWNKRQWIEWIKEKN